MRYHSTALRSAPHPPTHPPNHPPTHPPTRQQLVDGLLALVVATAHAGATLAAHSVDLIDEDDAGSLALGLCRDKGKGSSSAVIHEAAAIIRGATKRALSIWVAAAAAPFVRSSAPSRKGRGHATRPRRQTAPQTPRRRRRRRGRPPRLQAAVQRRYVAHRSPVRSAAELSRRPSQPTARSTRFLARPSPATALASRVLPVPGGPTSRAPLGILAPSLVYLSGFFRKSTTSCRGGGQGGARVVDVRQRGGGVSARAAQAR